MAIKTWTDVAGTIEQVNPELYQALSIIYESASLTERSELIFSIATYDYGAEIIKNGTPKWPNYSNFDQDFIFGDHLPYGIIIENSVNVLANSNYAKPNHQFSKAILKSGDQIGLFEFIDEIESNSSISKPHWNITSGVTNIYTSDTITSLGFSRKLLSQLRKNPLYENLPTINQLHEKSSNSAFLKCLMDRRTDKLKWTSSILYLSRSWFLYILKNKEKLNLEYFYKEAFRKTIPIQSRSDNTFEFIKSKIRSSRKGQSDHVFDFIELSYQMFNSLTPGFVTFDHNPEYFPVEAFQSILRECNEDVFILSPAYFSENSQRPLVLPFNVFFPAWPHLSGRNTADRVHDIARILDEFKRECETHNTMHPALQGLIDEKFTITVRHDNSESVPTVSGIGLDSKGTSYQRLVGESWMARFDRAVPFKNFAPRIPILRFAVVVM